MANMEDKLNKGEMAKELGKNLLKATKLGGSFKKVNLHLYSGGSAKKTQSLYDFKGLKGLIWKGRSSF